MNTNSYEIIYSLLGNNLLFRDKTKEGIRVLSNKYPKFQIQNELLLKQISSLTNEDPISIVFLVRRFLLDNKSITKIITKLELISKKSNSTNRIHKIEMISMFWEISDLLAFHAYLLSNQQEPFENLSDGNIIFKYCRDLGMSSSMKETLRKIRNANSHKFTVKEGLIIDDKGIVVCNINEIDNVYDCVNTIFKWALVSFLISIYYIPKFSSLFCLALFTEISKNVVIHTDYIDTLQQLVPELNIKNKLQNEEMRKHSSFISTASRRILNFYKGSILKKAIQRYNPVNRLTVSNLIPLVKKFDKRSIEFIEMMLELKVKLSLAEYDESIDSLINGIEEFKAEMIVGLREEFPSPKILKLIHALEKEK